MLTELIDWQLESRSDFRALKPRQLEMETPDVVALATAETLREHVLSGDLDFLDGLLDSYRWEKLPAGLMGRKAPGVTADMALHVYLDEEDNVFLGIYSVAEYWNGPAGPPYIGVKKLRHSVPLLMGETEELEEDFVYPHLIYLAINDAAQKSKMVASCEICGRPGPQWEMEAGGCESCLPRFY